MNESKKTLTAGNKPINKYLQTFWEKVDKTSSPNGCWLWNGNCEPRGYGIAWFGKPWPAHRLSWLINCGPIPDGLWVLHNCWPALDNRRCVNPKHLWLGTVQDNNNDRDKKGRTASGIRGGHYTHPEKTIRGVEQHLAKLTDDIVRKIRNIYAKGNITHTQIGKKLGVHKSTIRRAVNGITWKHI